MKATTKIKVVVTVKPQARALMIITKIDIN